MTMSVGTSGFQEKTELVKASGKAISSGAGSAIAKAAESVVKIVTDQSKVDKTLNKDSVQPIKFVLSQESPIEKLVENVRKNDGDVGKLAMHEFDGAIKKMHPESLKDARDYLVKEMSSPDNKDDQLLGAMLESVNKELDSMRVPEHFGPQPIICQPFPGTRPPIDIINLGPKPIKGGGGECGQVPEPIKKGKIDFENITGTLGPSNKIPDCETPEMLERKIMKKLNSFDNK